MLDRYKIGQPGTHIVPPNVEKLLQEPSKFKQSVSKFTKNNIKMTVPLELNQQVDLLKIFVDSSLAKIDVKYLDLKSLQA